MPPKRRKFESTFPAARIKKIMQLDDDVGRVASSVPVVISRAVEIFLNALLKKSTDYAASRSAKTLSVGHIKHCIEQEKQWDFLKDITSKISDIGGHEEEEESVPRRGRKRRNSQSDASAVPSTSTRRKKKHKKATEEGSGESVEESTNSAGLTTATLDGMPSIASASAGLTPPTLDGMPSIASASAGLTPATLDGMPSIASASAGLLLLKSAAAAAATSSVAPGVSIPGYAVQLSGGLVGTSEMKAASEDADTLASLAALTSGLQTTVSKKGGKEEKKEEEEDDYDA